MTGLSVNVFDETGVTLLGVVNDAADVKVSEELNMVGGGEFRVPYDSANSSLVAFDRVVKVWYEGAYRAAFLIEKIDRELIDSNGQRWITCSGRGLLAWLEDAVVYPQGAANGFDYYGATDRPFNFASDSGSWLNSVAWSTPVAVKFGTGLRKSKPDKWPEPSAYWIWKTNPDGAVTAGAVNYFRKTFTLASATKVRVFATCDNSFDLYIDGALMLSTSGNTADGSNWTAYKSTTKSLGAGTHTLSALGTNGKNTSGTNGAGLLVAVNAVAADGSTKVNIVKTDTSWSVTDTEPFWSPAIILRDLVYEARTRGVGRLNNFTFNYSAATDSNGTAWTTGVHISQKVGQDLLVTLDNLVDLGVDFWFDVGLMQLKAAERRGVDRTGNIRITPTRNTLSYGTTSEPQVKTAALVRSADGWTQTTGANVGTIGRRETFVEVGSTRSEATAAHVAQGRLKSLGRRKVTSSNIEALPTAYARPLVDFTVGDIISLTDPANPRASIRARVLSLTLTERANGAVVYTPEVEVL